MKLQAVTWDILSFTGSYKPHLQASLQGCIWVQLSVQPLWDALGESWSSSFPFHKLGALLTSMQCFVSKQQMGEIFQIVVVIEKHVFQRQGIYMCVYIHIHTQVLGQKYVWIHLILQCGYLKGLVLIVLGGTKNRCCTSSKWKYFFPLNIFGLQHAVNQLPRVCGTTSENNGIIICLII